MGVYNKTFDYITDAVVVLVGVYSNGIEGLYFRNPSSLSKNSCTDIAP